MWITQGVPLAQMAEPKEFRLNDFTPESLNAFRNVCKKAIDYEQEILPIYIQTYGGDANIMSGFMSEMNSARHLGLRFATIVGGCAMSAGALIFCYGDEGLRFIGPSGSLMLHGLQVGMDGRITDLKNFTRWSEQMEDRIFGDLSKHLKKKGDFLVKELERGHHADRYLSAEECYEKGLANHISIPRFIATLGASISFISLPEDPPKISAVKRAAAKTAKTKAAAKKTSKKPAKTEEP